MIRATARTRTHHRVVVTTAAFAYAGCTSDTPTDTSGLTADTAPQGDTGFENCPTDELPMLLPAELEQLRGRAHGTHVLWQIGSSSCVFTRSDP